MALQDRITEHPGRIKLTAVAGEPDTYDVTRAEGQVTQEGTELNATNLEAAFGLVYEEYTGSITYDAGTIGTRGVAVNMGSATKTGYKLISLLVTNATNASNYIVQPYVSSGTVYAGIYRASAAAVSGASITVRATWMPSAS